MLYPRPATLLLLPFCATAGSAWSQTDPATQPVVLDTVVVSGKKNPDKSTLTQLDLSSARRRIEQTAGGVGIVDATTYTEGRVSTLADALGTATGVYVQPRFGAEEARISIRGSGLQRTFHGRGLKLMQDGVPLNLADGSFDFQAVEALSARYVEVWRGANALQYGSSTLGGAVNFVSPNGYNSDRARMRAEAGSFGYMRAQVSTGDVADRFDYYLSASQFRQEGFRDHARQATGRLFANLGYQLAPSLETRFYIGHVHSNSDLPGSITRAMLEGDPRQANAANISGNQKRDIRWTRLSNKTVYVDGGNQFEFFGHYSDKQLHHPIFQVIDQHNRDVGFEARYIADSTLGGRRNRLTFGLAPSHGTTDEDRYSNAGGGSGPRTNQSRQTANNLEAYLENQHYVRPDVAVIVGLQHVKSSRKLDDRYITASGNESFDQSYEGTNPKLGVRYDFSSRLQIFANWSRSFEAPSFGELAGGLQPTLNAAQRANTFEVGSRGRLQSATWDIAYYDSHVRNELLQLTTSSSVPVTVNASKTLHRGIEMGLSGDAFRSEAGRVEGRVNALWNDFRFRNDPVYGNNQLPGVPKYFVRAQLGYRLAQGTLLSVHSEAASGYPVDFTNSFRAGGYGTWGLRVSGETVEGFSWFVDGRNLSDRKYAGTTGVVRNAGGQDSALFMPGDGRAVYVGVDWKFK